jgi:predicted neuraminidase
MCVQDPTTTKDAKAVGSVMFKDGTISDICDNLNLKSRESKFAQRVNLSVMNDNSKLNLLCFHLGLYRVIPKPFRSAKCKKYHIIRSYD